MPLKCCVPNCKGNYKTGPKVSVFGFPKDEELATRWLRAIKRENFTPTAYSRVCELHFAPDDVECTTSFFDATTGRKLTARLNKPRLKDGVVPSLLPNCPSYLSSPVVPRESPDARKNRKEEKALQSALVKSITDEERQRASRTFFSVAELKNKLDFLDQTY